MQATYANKDHRSHAIRLCEDICYNLRRVWGALDPKTLEMSELLSQLYTSMGHYREAMGVHESILRLVVEGDDGDDKTIDTMASKKARTHVELLKQCYLRLQGWDKSEATYKDLVHAILEMPEYRHQPEWQGVRGIEHWDKKEPASNSIGKFVVPEKWEFEDPKTADNKQDGSNKRSGRGMKRATSNWGLNSFHHVWDEEHEPLPHQNGNFGTHRMAAKKPVIVDGDDDGYESAAEEVNGRM